MNLTHNFVINGQARKDATAIIDLIQEQLEDTGEIYKVRFCEVILDAIEKHISAKRLAEKKKPLEPMTEEEALQFERNALTFGSYVDVQIGTVPTTYLTWFSESLDWDLKTRIKRYFLSERGKQRLREEENDG